MCNRYRPASVVRIRDAFGFTYIESGPDLRYNAAIGPLQPGPFVRHSGGRDEIVVGQWGLIPDGSKTRKPTRANGRPMSTNNARWGSTAPEAFTFKPAWWRGQRCLVPAEDFDEPYWGHGGPKCVWWRFRRRDGQPTMLAGVWSEWIDPESGEVVPSYSMFTIRANEHPVLRHMHRPDLDKDGNVLPPDLQDKRTVIPLGPEAWDAWLHGTPEHAAQLLQLPPADFYEHGPVDPASNVSLPA